MPKAGREGTGAALERKMLLAYEIRTSFKWQNQTSKGPLSEMSGKELSKINQ